MDSITRDQSGILAALVAGTVIDHIPAGHGMNIVQVLGLDKGGYKLVVGLNLPSAVMGAKDMIKIEGRTLSYDDANQVAVFAPDATISLIKEGQVVEKFQVAMPEQIGGTVKCPNPCCISRHEPVSSRFSVDQRRHGSVLTCHYCERSFSLERSESLLSGGGR